MQTLETIGRQIDVVKDLNSVVSMMKALAAVSIQQYEKAVEALAHYNRTIEMGFHIVLGAEPFYFNPREAEQGRTGVVVFGSDQGMCGRFNEEIVTFVTGKRRKENPREDWSVLVVGVRAEGQLADEGLLTDQLYEVPISVSEITDLVLELLLRIERWQVESNVNRLLVFHNRRTRASSFEPRMLQLLPIDPVLLKKWREEPWQSNSLPMFVTERSALLSVLIRHYLFVALFRACAESLASENAARIAAMQAAEKNIEERLEELSGTYHQLRQTLITEELLDVVTGFEALSQAP